MFPNARPISRPAPDDTRACFATFSRRSDATSRQITSAAERSSTPGQLPAVLPMIPAIVLRLLLAQSIDLDTIPRAETSRAALPPIAPTPANLLLVARMLPITNELSMSASKRPLHHHSVTYRLSIYLYHCKNGFLSFREVQTNMVRYKFEAFNCSIYVYYLFVKISLSVAMYVETLKD